MMKYEYKKDRYSSHSLIIKIIRENFKGGSILDIGCASGYLGKELGKGYYLVGVDLDKKSANIARKFYNEIIIQDINMSNISKNSRFDAIVFGDVLEHIDDPLKILNKIRPLLKKDGKIIISLPNIAFILCRAWLLFGKFNYMDKGPMDKGHLRFFTLRTSSDLVKKAGLRIEKIYAIPAPLPLIFPFIKEGTPLYALQNINNLITQAWKRMFAYQFVIVASK